MRVGTPLGLRPLDPVGFATKSLAVPGPKLCRPRPSLKQVNTPLIQALGSVGRMMSPSDPQILTGFHRWSTGIARFCPTGREGHTLSGGSGKIPQPTRGEVDQW